MLTPVYRVLQYLFGFFAPYFVFSMAGVESNKAMNYNLWLWGIVAFLICARWLVLAFGALSGLVKSFKGAPAPAFPDFRHDRTDDHYQENEHDESYFLLRHAGSVPADPLECPPGSILEMQNAMRAGAAAAVEAPAPEQMTGCEFEQFVAAMFRHSGWQAEVTAIGADQGLDILAKRGSVRLAVQCKRVGQPVGNAAVQEVHAARSYYDTQFACVVTTKTFTASAQVLARKLGVHLIHYGDIGKLWTLLEGGVGR
jgi:hypothetical protein